MKKTAIAFFLIAAYFAGFAGYVFFDHVFKNNNVHAKGTNLSSSDPSEKNTNGVITSPQAENKPAEQKIYDILGYSSKLNKKSKEDMEKWRKEIVELAKQNTDSVFINGNTNKKVVALTFDDGPDSKITPKILDILKENNIHGSFFVIGNRVSLYKSVINRIYKEGNLVLNHSFNHPDLTHLSPLEINRQISKTEDAISEVIGKKPAIIRPPYGATNNEVIEEAKSNDMKIAIWSIDTLDWLEKSPSNIANNVVDNVRPGDIILMHCNQDKLATYQALPTIIKKLKEKGYDFVDIAQLLNIAPYK